MLVASSQLALSVAGNNQVPNGKRMSAAGSENYFLYTFKLS